jgi:hypothetical protein
VMLASTDRAAMARTASELQPFMRPIVRARPGGGKEASPVPRPG